MRMRFHNSAGRGQVNAYLTGLDSDGRVVFVKANGVLIYPSSRGSPVPVPIDEDISISLPGQGGALEMTLPITITSGRVYFSEGKLNFFMVKTPNGDGVVQPSPTNMRDRSAGVSWGFVEMTYTKDEELFANISYVDFVGLILSMVLR